MYYDLFYSISKLLHIVIKIDIESHVMEKYLYQYLIMIFDTIKYKSYNRDTISFIVFNDINIYICFKIFLLESSVNISLFSLLKSLYFKYLHFSKTSLK